MKKLLSILLVVVLLMVGTFCAFALAETVETISTTAPLVDLTAVIVALMLAVFDFLLAWIAKVIVPPIKEWLATHTTEKQRGLLWDATCKLVDAAEQIIKGPLQGEKRLAYVEAGLKQRGLTVDNDLIEAAVKRMNDKALSTIGTAFDVAPLEVETTATFDVDENGEPDIEITHWSLAQLRSFCVLNKIPAEGCATREDYISAIVNGARQDAPEEPAANCAQRDYCDLDEDGNPIPEEPQSTVE